MSIRPPKALAPKDALKDDPLTAALEHEVLAEKAATYGRLLARLERALQLYRDTETDDSLAAAGEALWHVAIQRELCGFRNHEAFYREYRVPPAVRLRMGLRPRAG